jgi:hypothetical protein
MQTTTSSQFNKAPDESHVKKGRTSFGSMTMAEND